MIPAILGGLAIAAPVANAIGKVFQPSQPSVSEAAQKAAFDSQFKQMSSMRKLTGTDLANQLNSLDFNGKQALATQLPNKMVELEDESGRKITGLVETVRFEGQDLKLKVNGREFGINSLRNVMGV